MLRSKCCFGRETKSSFSGIRCRLLRELFRRENRALQKLLGETFRNSVTDKISEIFASEIRQEIMSVSKFDDEKYNTQKEKISSTITSKIMLTVKQLDISSLIAEESGKLIKDKISGTMFKMLVSDDLIKSVTKMIGDEVQKYLEENGAKLVREQTDKKLDETDKKTLY